MTIGIYTRVKITHVDQAMDRRVKLGMVGVVVAIGDNSHQGVPGYRVHIDDLDFKPYIFLDELEELP